MVSEFLHLAVEDDRVDLPEVSNVLERIRIDDDQIRQLSGFDFPTLSDTLKDCAGHLVAA